MKVSLLQCFVASLCLAAIGAGKKRAPPRKKDLPLFLLSGITGYTLYLTTFNIASTMLNATTTCMIISIPACCREGAPSAEAA